MNMEQEYRRHERRADNVMRAMRSQSREHILSAVVFAITLALLVSMLAGCKEDGRKDIEPEHLRKLAYKERWELFYYQGFFDGEVLSQRLHRGEITSPTQAQYERDSAWTNALSKWGSK